LVWRGAGRRQEEMTEWAKKLERKDGKRKRIEELLYINLYKVKVSLL
jgi:hypothetical protein